MERYYLTRTTTTDGYALEVQEVDRHDPLLIPVLNELDLLTYSEGTFSRYTLGALLRYGRIFTITADGLIIGACHCLRGFDDPNEVIIFNMALRPGWRGHGLGTRFLQGVIDRLRARGTLRISLLVEAGNHRAIAVYRTKFTFQHVATYPNEYNTGQEYYLMRLELPLASAASADDDTVS
ncbi:MAG: GNAT family N-acetyltransferase [Myxococcales bacterium]|nr:GNAT family N-acetyltransferase [Myxococcales bacterium]